MVSCLVATCRFYLSICICPSPSGEGPPEMISSVLAMGRNIYTHNSHDKQFMFLVDFYLSAECCFLNSWGSVSETFLEI